MQYPIPTTVNISSQTFGGEPFAQHLDGKPCNLSWGDPTDDTKLAELCPGSRGRKGPFDHEGSRERSVQHSKRRQSVVGKQEEEKRRWEEMTDVLSCGWSGLFGRNFRSSHQM